MGKGSNKKANAALEAQGRLADKLVDVSEREMKIAEDIYGETTPSRQFATNTYMGLAKGNVPGIEKYTAGSINAATQQYSLAKKAAESMPPGAARDAALRDLNMQQAAQNTAIYSGAQSDALSRTASIGLGGVGMTTGAFGSAGQMLGGAANTYGSMADSYNKMASNKGGMAASGVGAAGSIVGALV